MDQLQLVPWKEFTERFRIFHTSARCVCFRALCTFMTLNRVSEVQGNGDSLLKGKVKVKLSLCYEGVLGSGGVAPLIL